jgi:hypothetical protein
MKRNSFAAGDKRKRVVPQAGIEVWADVGGMIFQDTGGQVGTGTVMVKLEKSELRSDGPWWLVTVISQTLGYIWVKESNLHL